ncbi:Flagellar motility protein MotE, a chaperone for MotC folding [Tranquillimonas rosea]|uniref:Flagellar motility protein MotE, a chaperone for MotC folding n=1 Tax=Tranquillimonas rosea TaxID=641238 RepID=A0A1H9UBK2_9RHOB|nr:hypothetical protein [Tranquillimonas rosea]SES06920.1 Flagellar motility protein MotE, a chaperone for MotC folding [Tranquillimonas rosea]
MSPGKRCTYRRPARALPLLATLFAASGLLRLSGETGERVTGWIGAGYAYAAAEVAGTDDSGCEMPPDVAAVLSALKERDSRLQEREAEMDARETALAEAEDEIRAQLDQLVAAEEALSETLAQADTAAEADITRLVAVYENMKPADAAVLFEEMSPSFAAGFIGRMRPESAAALLADLEPQTAYSISAILAGRNANAPKDEPAER